MKYLLVFLAVVAVTRGAEVQDIPDVHAMERSVSSMMLDALVGVQQQMPCGWPGLGIPPVAPLQTSHQAINIKTDTLGMEGEINNFRLDGMDDITTNAFTINLILSRFTFDFTWNRVQITTLYSLLMELESILPVKTHFEGLAKFAIVNARIIITGRYSTGLLTGGNLRFRDCYMRISIGNVESEIEGLSKYNIINRKLNQVIEEWFMLAINDNTEYVAELTNSYFVPLANGLIGDRSIADLISIIGGIGGGSGTGRETCVKEQVLLN